MIIEYLLSYKNEIPVVFCGQFRDYNHFLMFVKVEATYGRIMQGIVSIKK